MTRHSRLDDPEYAAFAWKRYWRLMRWMLAVTTLVTIIALGAFWYNNGFVSIHFFIATAGAIVGAMMLTAALMGLVFLSSGTGHDEAIDDPFAELAEDDK
jgi:ABC-type multidrug transport system fused ATPase/permease subunit